MAPSQSQKVTEQYQGPGKVVAAIGTASVYGIVPIGAAAGYATKQAYDIYKELKIVGKTPERAAEMEKLALKGLGKAGMAGIVALVTAGIASIIGIVVGWRSAKDSRQQYEHLAQAHNAAIDNMAALSNSNTQLAQELASEKRLYTEMLEKQRDRSQHGEHAGHAAKEASHASHVEKHAAKKEAAMGPQMAV